MVDSVCEVLSVLAAGLPCAISVADQTTSHATVRLRPKSVMPVASSVISPVNVLHQMGDRLAPLARLATAVARLGILVANVRKLRSTGMPLLSIQLLSLRRPMPHPRPLPLSHKRFTWSPRHSLCNGLTVPVRYDYSMKMEGLNR